MFFSGRWFGGSALVFLAWLAVLVGLYPFVQQLAYAQVADLDHETVQLGKPFLDSYLGQALDLRIEVKNVPPQQLHRLSLLRSGKSAYAELGYAYFPPLHNRIVSELVTKGNVPYIYISSVGPVDTQDFVIGVILSLAGKKIVRGIPVHLAQVPKIINEADIPLTEDEVLFELTAILSLVFNLDKREVLRQIFQRIKEGQPEDDRGYRSISQLRDLHFDKKWLEGFSLLLPVDMKKEFAAILMSDGANRAVRWALFGDSEHRILTKLVSPGSERIHKRVRNTSDQIKQIVEQIATLERRLLAMEAMPVAEDVPDSLSIASVWNDFVSQIVLLGLDDWRFLLTKPFWLLVSAILLLWWALSVNKLMKLRKLHVRSRNQIATPRRATLHGSREFIGGITEEQGEEDTNIAQHPDCTPLDGQSELDSQLDLAITLVEMGNIVKAKQIIAKVLRAGSRQQQQRAHKILKDIP